MFCYLTSYRFYTLAKIGLGLAYFWLVWDFFQIHSACWRGLDLFLSDQTTPGVRGGLAQGAADFFASRVSVTTIFAMSPAAVFVFCWGRYRWLQFAVGLWMSISIAAMISKVGIFCSTADVWLNFTLGGYALAALTCPADQWSKREPGLSREHWKENPILESTYAWLVVLVQFTVYVFAGINKLIDGWEPWVGGKALQNLALDSSMHDYLRGIAVPYWLSLVLCYYTLFQRLIVPFGFYFMRYRGWAVLILGTMHLGYDLLMQVAIFPLIGVSSLLMIVPPRSLAEPLFVRPSLHRPRRVARLLQKIIPHSLPSRLILGVFSVWMLLESTRLTLSEAYSWENRFALTPAWRMFADGGINAGKKWRLILLTPYEEKDDTPRIKLMLPHLWRDRFYTDQILHYLLAAEENHERSDSAAPVKCLLQADEQLYSQEATRQGRKPAILNAGFDIFTSTDGEREPRK